MNLRDPTSFFPKPVIPQITGLMKVAESLQKL
jgi:hypothetical protein